MRSVNGSLPEPHRLRVGFLTAEYPGDGTCGGLGTAIRQIVHALAELGHEANVLLCGNLPMFGDSDGVVPLYHLQPPALIAGLPAPLGRGPSLWLGRELAQLAAKLRLDVLEAPDCGGLSAFLDVFKTAGILSVVRLHTGTAVLRRVDNLKPNRLADWLERRAIESADLVTANSLATIERTRAVLGIRRQDIHVLPNPVAPPFFDLPETNGPGDPLVVFHGRLQWAKGPDVLARAIPAILQHHPATRFRLIGEDSATAPGNGCMLNHVRGLLPPSVAGQVEFTGYVEPGEVPLRLADATLCVFPSRWEGFGIACAEAMGCGKPVVVSEALRELVEHGLTGLCVPIGDADALANAVCILLSDRSLSQELGRCARQKARRLFHPKVVAEATAQLYTTALGRKHLHCQTIAAGT